MAHMMAIGCIGQRAERKELAFEVLHYGNVHGRFLDGFKPAMGKLGSTRLSLSDLMYGSSRCGQVPDG